MRSVSARASPPGKIFLPPRRQEPGGNACWTGPFRFSMYRDRSGLNRKPTGQAAVTPGYAENKINRAQTDKNRRCVQRNG